MIYAIVPAAGKAMRLQPLALSKELLPLFIKKYSCSLDFNLQQVSQVADAISVITNQKKTDLISFLERTRQNYKPTTILIASPLDLPDSTMSPYSIINPNNDDKFILTLPDTYWEPINAPKTLVAKLNDNYDVVLGLFNSAPSKFYDSVKLDGNVVSKILVKKDPPASEWFWGSMAFNGKAYRLMNKKMNSKRKKGGEVLLGETINDLIQKKDLKVGGVKLNNNLYFDLGTPERYAKFLYDNLVKAK